MILCFLYIIIGQRDICVWTTTPLFYSSSAVSLSAPLFNIAEFLNKSLVSVNYVYVMFRVS